MTGSTDNSQNIIDLYVDKYKNIRSYIKENGGLSDARNYGINKAIGEYIMFVDSDDYIECNCLENLYNIACKNNLDILKFNYYDERINSSANKIKDFDNKIFNGIEYLKKNNKNEWIWTIAWNAIYNRSFINNNMLRFKKGRLHEDELWTPQCILKSRRIMQINNTYYFYKINPNSITKKKDRTKNALDIIKTCNDLETIYKAIDDAEVKKMLLDVLASRYFGAIVMGKMYGKEKQYQINKDFLKRNCYSMRNKLKIVLYNFSPKLYYKINILKNMR